MKKQSQPKRREHIPALTPEQMQIALQKLQDARIPPAAKKQLQAMLEAASNPDSETTAAIIKTLSKDRQELVKEMADALTLQTTMVVRRAGQGLDAISDDEWNKLVNEANNGTE